MAAAFALIAAALFGAAPVTTQFGLRHMDSLDGGAVSIVSPIAATYPLFTLVLNAIILREERLSARLISGVALMVSGVAALSE